MTHDFAERLAFSHAAEDLPFWKTVYERAFPGLVAMPSLRKNGEHQKAGLDRAIVLENGKTIHIDEKVREKDYGDFALEYYHQGDRNWAGWMELPLRADFIAYAVLPLATAWLLPVLPLQRAWRENKRDWVSKAQQHVAGYALKAAPNRNYRTWNLCLPRKTLLDAVCDAFAVQWGAA